MSKPAVVRPHHKVWPKRLPRELVDARRRRCGSTSRSRRRAIPTSAAYLFFGRALSFARAAATRPRRSPAGCRARACKRATGSRSSCRTARSSPIAFYGVLRANAVVVPVNPMNRAEEFKHYITDPQTKVVICSADLAGIVAEANAAVPASAAPARRCWSRATPTRCPRARSPPPTRRRRRWTHWLRADPALPRRAASRWLDALAAQPRARPAHRAARRPGAAALHLGHDRPAQGLHAHAPHADAQRGRRRSGATAAPETVGLGVVPMFHITGMMYGVLGSVYIGRTGRADAALGPRARRAADLAATGSRTGPASRRWSSTCSAARTTRASTCRSLRYLSGGGAAMPQAVARAPAATSSA